MRGFFLALKDLFLNKNVVSLFLLISLISLAATTGPIVKFDLKKEHLKNLNRQLWDDSKKSCQQHLEEKKPLKEWLDSALSTIDLRFTNQSDKKTVQYSLQTGTEPYPVILFAKPDDCEALATLVHFILWKKASGFVPQRTYFLVSSDVDSSRKQLKIDALSAISAQAKSYEEALTLVKTWVAQDQSPIQALGLSDKLKMATKAIKEIAMIDKTKRDQTLENLKAINESKSQDITAAIKLNQTLYSVENLRGLNEDYKILLSLREAAERGQWDKMVPMIKRLRGFELIDTMNPEKFFEHHKQAIAKNEDLVDPLIWLLYAKGKKNLDVLIELMERQIDKSRQRLSAVYTKFEQEVAENKKAW